MKERIFLAILLVLTTTVHAAADKCSPQNYAERKAYILNFAPGLELKGYDFCNRYDTRRNYPDDQFVQNLSWKNVGEVSIIAFEVHTLKFDPFNRELIGSKSIIPGIDSARWQPLLPGQEAGDGLIGHSYEDVYTAIAYISTVRYANGTVWTIDRTGLASSVKAIVATFEDRFATANDLDKNSPRGTE
jgi:hypothetical protein